MSKQDRKIDEYEKQHTYIVEHRKQKDLEEKNKNKYKKEFDYYTLNRCRGKSESLLDTDEKFDDFTLRVIEKVNEIASSDGVKIKGVSYPDKFTAVITYQTKRKED